jgi:hypothetical protein
MGLPVAWVTINPGHDEGIDFAAAVKIPDELIDYERDVLALVCSIAAPAQILSHIEHDIGHYAAIEARVAYDIGAKHGIEFDVIYDICAGIVNELWDEISDLANRLAVEGTVTFVTQ